MKILKKKDINEIDFFTSNLHDFIHNLPNDSIKKPFEKRSAIYKLNEIRTMLDLPMIISFVSGMPTLNVNPPKKEECNHYFELLQTGKTGEAILFCRHCAEVKRIALNEEANRPNVKQKYLNISIDEFNDVFDSAASFEELKDLLIAHAAMWEGE